MTFTARGGRQRFLTYKWRRCDWMWKLLDASLCSFLFLVLLPKPTPVFVLIVFTFLISTEVSCRPSLLSSPLVCFSSRLRSGNWKIPDLQSSASTEGQIPPLLLFPSLHPSCCSPQLSTCSGGISNWLLELSRQRQTLSGRDPFNLQLYQTISPSHWRFKVVVITKIPVEVLW